MEGPNYFMIVFLMILVVVAVYYWNNKDKDDKTTIETPEEVVATVSEPIEEKMIFPDIRSPEMNLKEMSLVGYLQREFQGEEFGEYFYYIVDDEENRIRLTWLDEGERANFPESERTEEIYNVTGLFNYDHLGYDFGVASIEKI